MASYDRSVSRKIRETLQSRLGRIVDRIVDARVEMAVSKRIEESPRSDLGTEQIRHSLDELSKQIQQSDAELVSLGATVREIRNITSAHFDRTVEHRHYLRDARASTEYALAYTEPEPLVSVRIATYDRPDILFGRTLPSVLNQTYPHLEVIIVGDGCGEETARHARAVTDPRVRYVNLPYRAIYPQDPALRWLVAGTPGMNYGAQLAQGRWIAPLDDDDEFTPDHIETLLDKARDGRFEMVHGRMAAVFDDSSKNCEIGVHPPEYGQFGFQAAIYQSALKFFEYETRSWVLDEPSDWNLCRRMLAAGLLIGFAPQVVTTLYPTGPR